MRATVTAPFAIMAVLLAGSCQQVDVIELPDPDDGVPVIVISADELATAPAIALTEVTRVDGSSELNPLSFVAGVALSDRKDLYVLDRQRSQVIVFDSSGALLRTIGGVGAGPGELSSPSHIALGGDTLLVMDLSGINRYLTDGTFLDRVRVRNPPDTNLSGNVYMYPQSLHSTRQGIVVSFPQSMGARPNRIRRDTTSLHTLDPHTGITSATVAYVVSSDLYPLGEFGGGWAWFTVPRSFTATPSGLLVMTNADGKDVDIVPITAEPPRRIRFETERRAVERSELIALQESLVRLLPLINPDTTRHAEWEAALRTLPHNRYWPVVGKVVAASDDRVLIERPDLSGNYDGRMAGPTIWDLVESDGGLVGRMVVPEGTTPMAIARGTLVGVSLDSLDVPSIVRYVMSGTEAERE